MNTDPPNSHAFTFNGANLIALPTGALWWAEQSLLCVSDLHLGKSERIARRNGTTLPPYETRDTLDKLAADLDATGARAVVCLGDSFDDLVAAHALPDEMRLLITRLQAGRRWVWIEGNHDPGPIEFGGSHIGELTIGPLVFRHIAKHGATGEVSGHYHPKVLVRTRARSIARPAFLVDDNRLILPAFGTYTGGLWSHDAAFDALLKTQALAILTGRVALAVPMPRGHRMPISSRCG